MELHFVNCREVFMSYPITSECVVAYSQCPRKALLLIRRETVCSPTEYDQMLDARASANRATYVVGLSGKELAACPMVGSNQAGSVKAVRSGDLIATCDALVSKQTKADKSKARLEPHLVLGTHGVSGEHKLALAYAGYVVGQATRCVPDCGFAIPFCGKPQRVRLEPLYPRVQTIIARI